VITEKRRTRCGKIKPIDEFPKCGSGRRRANCKSCYAWAARRRENRRSSIDPDQLFLLFGDLWEACRTHPSGKTRIGVRRWKGGVQIVYTEKANNRSMPWPGDPLKWAFVIAYRLWMDGLLACSPQDLETRLREVATRLREGGTLRCDQEYIDAVLRKTTRMVRTHCEREGIPWE